MKKMKKVFAVLSVISSLASLSGCGNAGGSVDPLSLFNDSSIPQLDTIFSTSGGFTTISNFFSASSPYWKFQASGGTWGAISYLAPAKGIVTSLAPATLNGSVSGTAVTIAHSGRLATRYVGITPIVRSGDSVIAGQVIGSLLGYYGSLNEGAFQVLLDGVPVCPTSYLSSNFRAQLSSFFANTNFLCQ
jgi:murein DD-endopeptidase MepM/ murein hydrolase activator NlpD